MRPRVPTRGASESVMLAAYGSRRGGGRAASGAGDVETVVPPLFMEKLRSDSAVGAEAAAPGPAGELASGHGGDARRWLAVAPSSQRSVGCDASTWVMPSLAKAVVRRQYSLLPLK